MDGTEDGCPAVTAGLPTVPTGPRCQHLRLLKLQGEAADIKEACKTQQTVSDLLACLSDNDAQHSTLPDLRPLRLTHPTNWHEHAKGLCEQAGTSLAAAKPGEEENMMLEASRIDLEEKWGAACNSLQCIPSQLRPVRTSASTGWKEPQAVTNAQIGGNAAVQAALELPVVVQIAVHTPDSNFHRFQAILLAARHTLADLRSAIYCVNDKYAAQHLGSTPSGGYMLLNDTLYVDCSDQSAEDYTKPILSFLAAQRNSMDQRITRYLQTKGLATMGGMRTAHQAPHVQSMHSVRIEELKLTPGQHGRYMYAHCGACEHMLVIEDVRLKHASDPDLSGMPVMLDTCATPLHRCCICASRPSTKVTYGDHLAPSSPAFFCSWCYEDLHLGADGQPLILQPQMDVFDVEV